MYRELISLRKKFESIKKGGLHRSVCKGTAGVGQTFENLLGKSADTLPWPDYKGIEIKTKLGYSKTPMTLFSLVPKSVYDNSIEFLVNNYGYPESSFSPYNALRAKASCKEKILTAKKYYFTLEVDRNNKKLILVIKNKFGEEVNKDFSWDFDVLKERLVTKLNYMALVIAYPYSRYEEIYYKYFKMTLYKLKGFDVFLDLIEDGIINVIFNIGIHRDDDNYGKIKDHGTSFKIDNMYIYKLFKKLYV